MTLTNSEGSMTSSISSSSLRNITSFGLWVFGQYFNNAITVYAHRQDTRLIKEEAGMFGQPILVSY